VPSCTSVHSPSASPSASASAPASASASASARPRSHHLSALHEREEKKNPSQHLIPSKHPVTTSYLVPSHTTPCRTRPSPLHFSACARVPPTRASPPCNVPLISLAAPPPYAAAQGPKQSRILHAGLLCAALRCSALPACIAVAVAVAIAVAFAAAVAFATRTTGRKSNYTCHMLTCPHATPHPRRAAALRDTHTCMHLSARKLALVVYPILTTPILSPPYLAPISLVRHLLSLLSCSNLQSKTKTPHPVISSSCRPVILSCCHPAILSVTLSSRHPVICLRRLHRRASYSRHHHVTSSRPHVGHLTAFCSPRTDNHALQQSLSQYKTNERHPSASQSPN
jgi:hypothetical protein